MGDTTSRGEINDAEWEEQVLERAGAIDVAKASAKVWCAWPGRATEASRGSGTWRRRRAPS